MREGHQRVNRISHPTPIQSLPPQHGPVLPTPDSGGAATTVSLRAVDLMRPVIPAAQLTDSVFDVVQMMDSHGLRSLPVQLDRHRHRGAPAFAGTLRAKDIFQAIVAGTSTLERCYYDWNVLDMPAARLMKPAFASVDARWGMEKVIAALTVESLDGMVVVDDGQSVGYLYSNDVLDLLIRMGDIFKLLLDDDFKEMTQDLCMVLSKFVQLLRTGVFSVQQIMKTPTLFLEDDDDLMKAMSMFASGYCNYLPVLTAAGAFAGIVSDRDVLHELASLDRGDPVNEVLFDGRLSRQALRDKTVADVMQRQPQTLDGRMHFWEAGQFLLERDVRCLIVRSQGGAHGLLSQSSLIKGFCNLIEVYPNVMELLGADDQTQTELRQAQNLAG
jgi:CBS-domain-containing membrane protein